MATQEPSCTKDSRAATGWIGWCTTKAFSRIGAAIAREKQIKGWTRVKKMALIVGMNPTWRDSSEDWGKPAKASPVSVTQAEGVTELSSASARRREIFSTLASAAIDLRIGVIAWISAS